MASRPAGSDHTNKLPPKNSSPGRVISIEGGHMTFARASRSLIDLLRFNRAVQTVAVVACLFVTGKLMLGGQVPPVPGGLQAYTPTVGSGYLTHISTDKPIYRLGEKVYVRA